MSKMASEDVIELGSSDDEAEPASKKMKPMPNAMVHIPRGVTIKPAKSIVSSIPKQLAGISKNVTVTNISKRSHVVTNPFAAKNKTIPERVVPKIVVQKNMVPKITALKNVVPKNIGQINAVNKNINHKNALHVIKNINSQVLINKIPVASKMLNNPIKVNSPRTINSLPPSITVTRTTGNIKRPCPINTSSSLRKKIKVPKPVFTEVLTVELDDDDISSSSNASPQWYLRPEDQKESIQEESNNKEPEKQQFVEITIEDSPVKPPPQNKRACEVSADLAVTIDDSPVKTLTENNTASGSDTEHTDKLNVPHSKKKLEYPKEPESVEPGQCTIEIEISPIAQGTMILDNVTNKNKIDIIEIEESPLKVDSEGPNTPKKDNPKPQLETVKSIEAFHEDDLSEFHPVYRDFIKMCFQLENSDDMKKIVEKKIKTYYRQVPKDYTESEDFIDMVSSKIFAMKAGPQKMYLYIKDIVDELNLQRKMAKSQILNNISKKQSDSNDFLYGEDSEYDSKRQRQIRKLEKTLKKLHRAIQKLEMQEVDFDDDEDSVYLLTESDEDSSSNKDSDKQLEKDPKALLQRYKERMVRVHAKFCQLTNTKMPSEPRVQIDARPGQPSGPAKRLEKWINKKVPIGTPVPFPDFHDVLRCVREANNEDKLGWNEADIMEEARDLFTRCGKKLQRRRQENEWRIAASRITTAEVDPAEQNEDLKRQLEENKKLASNKETEVFNKFADRQSQLKLEAEEIGDKEAEESPVESEEDEPTDESSLKNTEKRKERLKRLLQEKSKKNTEEKENEGEINTNGNQVTVEMLAEDTVEKDISSIQKSTDISYLKENEDKTLQANKETKKENLDLAEKEQINETEEVLIIKSNKEEHNYSENTEKTEEENKLVDTNIIDTMIEEKKIHNLSDDSNNMESDVDELHLLQKLHSGSEINSSTQSSSEIDTPIAISDTLGSSSENNKQASDVISIENSSYSDSETTKDSNKPNDNKILKVADKVDDILVDTGIECFTIGVQKKVTITNNEEYIEPIEDILLASSDDEAVSYNDPIPDSENSKYDNISIGDTIVERVDQANNSTKSNTDEKQEDVKNKTIFCDTTDIKSTKHDSLDNIIIETVQGNVSESDITNKQEDECSVESVTFVPNEDGLPDAKNIENEEKGDENANKSLKRSEESNDSAFDVQNKETETLQVDNTNEILSLSLENVINTINSNQTVT